MANLSGASPVAGAMALLPSYQLWQDQNRDAELAYLVHQVEQVLRKARTSYWVGIGLALAAAVSTYAAVGRSPPSP